jgi:hypothetical protein
MMTYEKKLKDFTMMFDEEPILGGYEDPDPHENSIESSLHFMR